MPDSLQTTDGKEDAGEAEGEERTDSVASKGSKKEQKLINQFNYSERASQTLNNPLRVWGPRIGGNKGLLLSGGG